MKKVFMKIIIIISVVYMIFIALDILYWFLTT